MSNAKVFANAVTVVTAVFHIAYWNNYLRFNYNIGSGMDYDLRNDLVIQHVG